MLYYNLLLFAITLGGGSIPLMIRFINEKRMQYLLAFSGSFLLSITFLHLLPETFADVKGAGFLLLLGFFLQMVIQRITHGAEHGHSHIGSNGHHHHVPLISILGGLSFHAFMEGLPLGFSYRMEATEPALYLAVAAHKLPEAMVATSLVAGMYGRGKGLITLLFFALITPGAGVLAQLLGDRYESVNHAVMTLVPVVAGAFIHIATTIFFESGTRQHAMSWQKTLAMALGVGIGLLTLLLE